uniref:CENP-V/GFA domain-containing protein n=1 Tax=Globodera pallida TaxID=36090 RepID=A0A183BHK8_GLOPA
MKRCAARIYKRDVARLFFIQCKRCGSRFAVTSIKSGFTAMNMRFIHPFPGFQLSSDDLLCAVSAWLTPPIDDGAGNAGADCSSTTVPMVFSHDEWFVQFVPALGMNEKEENEH